MRTVELARCGRVAIETCMGVKPSEQVLIVADTLADPGVSEAMLGAARAAGAEAMLLVFPARPRGGMEPPPAVRNRRISAASPMNYWQTRPPCSLPPVGPEASPHAG
jgi:hypothetical protein